MAAIGPHKPGNILCEAEDPNFEKFMKYARHGPEDGMKVIPCGEDGYWIYVTDCDSWTWWEPDLDYLKNAKGDAEIGNPRDLGFGQEVSIMRLYGVDRAGKSVCCYVEGFTHSFYARTPRIIDQEEVERLKNGLNLELLSKIRQQHGNQLNYLRLQPVLRVELLDESCNEKILGYSRGRGGEPFEGSMLKITCASPGYLKEAARILPKASDTNHPRGNGFELYEVDVDPVDRFLATQNIPCCSWVSISDGVVVSSPRSSAFRMSHAQVEVLVDYRKIQAVPEFQVPRELPKLRILSCDIEILQDKETMRKTNNKFPDHGDKQVLVVQIGNVLYEHGSKSSPVRVIFTFGSCDPIGDAIVFSYETEKEMMNAWSLFVSVVDPDILTGFNCNRFDFSFMLARAKAMGFEKFPYFGRAVNTPANYRPIPQNEAYQNYIDRYIVNAAYVPGRPIIDMLPVALAELGVSVRQGYRLNIVCQQLLNQEKDDVHFTEIPDLQNGDSDSRCKLAKYCLQDAWLALQLLLYQPREGSKNVLEILCQKSKENGIPLHRIANNSGNYNRVLVDLRPIKKMY